MKLTSLILVTTTVIITLFPFLALAESTLLIGDSHTVGPFGDELANLLSEKDPNFYRYGLSGSTPRQFTADNPSQRSLTSGAVMQVKNQIKRTEFKIPATVPHINSLLSSHKPSRVIVSLGENLIDYRGKNFSKSRIKFQVDELLTFIQKGGAKCIWILPTWTNQENRPPYQKSNALLDEANLYMKSVIGNRCQVISGTEISELSPHSVQTQAGDWLHHTKLSGKRWAEAVMSRIQMAPPRRATHSESKENPTSGQP